MKVRCLVIVIIMQHNSLIEDELELGRRTCPCRFAEYNRDDAANASATPSLSNQDKKRVLLHHDWRWLWWWRYLCRRTYHQLQSCPRRTNTLSLVTVCPSMTTKPATATTTTNCLSEIKKIYSNDTLLVSELPSDSQNDEQLSNKFVTNCCSSNFSDKLVPSHWATTAIVDKERNYIPSNIELSCVKNSSFGFKKSPYAQKLLQTSINTNSRRKSAKNVVAFHRLIMSMLIFVFSSAQLLSMLIRVANNSYNNNNNNNNNNAQSFSSFSFVFPGCAAWDETYKPSQFYGRHKMPGQPPFTETRILDYLFKELHYDNRTRPPGYYSNSTQGGPVVVRVNILLRSISKIDDVRMEYTTTITFREEWHDERLAFDDGGILNYLTLPEPQRVWKPDLFFYPEKQGHFHEITTPNLLFRIYPDGRVLYSVRLSMVMSCPMKLNFYPMDTQNCTIDMASYAYTTNDIDFRWRPTEPVQIRSNFHLPRFELRNVSTGDCSVITTTGSYSCLKVDLIFERQLNYFIFQVYIPTGMLVVVSWVSFWLDQDAIPARITLGVTTLLTVITSTHGINANLPPVAYTKAIDVWTGGCTFFVFAALLEFALVNYASRREFRTTTHKIMSPADVAAAAAVHAAYSFSGGHLPGLGPPSGSDDETMARVSSSRPRYGSMYKRINRKSSSNTPNSSLTPRNHNNNNVTFNYNDASSFLNPDGNTAESGPNFSTQRQNNFLHQAYPATTIEIEDENSNNPMSAVDMATAALLASSPPPPEYSIGDSFGGGPERWDAAGDPVIAMKPLVARINAAKSALGLTNNHLAASSCQCEVLDPTNTDHPYNNHNNINALDAAAMLESSFGHQTPLQRTSSRNRSNRSIRQHLSGGNHTAFNLSGGSTIPTLGTLDANTAATALMMMNEAVSNNKPALARKPTSNRHIDHRRHAGRTRFFFKYFYWPEATAKQIDFCSRFGFPLAFMLFQIGYWGIYLSARNNKFFWESWWYGKA